MGYKVLNAPATSTGGGSVQRKRLKKGLLFCEAVVELVNLKRCKGTAEKEEKEEDLRDGNQQKGYEDAGEGPAR